MQCNILIDIQGVISKEDNSEITEKESDNITDAILELLESKGYMFGGGFGLQTEKEYMLENK